MGKALAINGSPRMEKGNTALVLGAFIQGLSDAGCEVELHYPSRMRVELCGCGRIVYDIRDSLFDQHRACIQEVQSRSQVVV